MYLFIFESVGTSELLLVGIVALIFLGPRKLPEYARKIGKIMTEFRGTANEFKETWQREANFEQEAKSFDLNGLEVEPVARVDSISAPESTDPPAPPEIKSIDPASFEHPLPAKVKKAKKAKPTTQTVDANDKQNWL